MFHEKSCNNSNSGVMTLVLTHQKSCNINFVPKRALSINFHITTICVSQKKHRIDPNFTKILFKTDKKSHIKAFENIFNITAGKSQILLQTLS